MGQGPAHPCCGHGRLWPCQGSPLRCGTTVPFLFALRDVATEERQVTRCQDTALPIVFLAFLLRQRKSTQTFKVLRVFLPVAHFLPLS